MLTFVDNFSSDQKFDSRKKIFKDEPESEERRA